MSHHLAFRELPASTAPAPPSAPEPAIKHDSHDDVDNDDEDPVTAEYDIYITPKTAASLYLLQFPTREREQPYNELFGTAPTEMRVKPDSGFLEMDVPINADFYYDKEKGSAWGAALAKSKKEGAQGHGLAAGFAHVAGMRAAAGRGRGGAGRQGGEEEEELRGDQYKMRVQTLGGQIIKDDRGRPNYMIGAFRGSELHLTPTTGLIQMRPQFHHIDAKTIQDRTRARITREAAANPSGAAPAEARIVQLVSKPTSHNDSESLEGQGETTKEYLNKAMEEQWTRLKFYDEEAEEAYDAYHGVLFHNRVEGAVRLVAGMGNEAYVDAISAPRLDPSGGRVVRPMYRKGGKRGVKGKVGGKAGDAVAGDGEAEAEADGGEEEDEDDEEDEEEHEEQGAGEADVHMDEAEHEST